MAERTALIAGATGLVGAHLLELLLKSPHYSEVTVLVRRPLDKRHPKLNQMVTDFETLPQLGAPHDVFCALGTTIKKAGSQAAFRKVDLEYPLSLARQSVEEGSRQFLLVSSVGADIRSSNFYLRTKAELEDALGALPFRSLHVYHPSFLMGQRAEERSGEKIGIVFAKALGPLLIGSLRKYRAIPADALARAMVECAVRIEPGRHEYSYDSFKMFVR